MNIETTLKNLGFTDKETHVYLALIELGEATVSEVSKKSGIKRPTAYVVLYALQEKGFVSQVLRRKKKLFSPQHPKKIAVEAELRLKEVKEIVPELEFLLRKQEGRPRVKMYEGKQELDNAYDEAFVVRGDNMYIGTLKLSQEAFPRTFKKAELAKLSPEFTIREILDESEESRAYASRVQGPYRKAHFLPKKHLPFEADIGIFGNHALITSVKKEYFTIDIESPEIARAFRIIFDILWEATSGT